MGRIEVLFSDKTGTLTQNDMIMKKINLEFINFSTETISNLEEMLKKTCEIHANGPMGDLDENG